MQEGIPSMNNHWLVLCVPRRPCGSFHSFFFCSFLTCFLLSPPSLPGVGYYLDGAEQAKAAKKAAAAARAAARQQQQQQQQQQQASDSEDEGNMRPLSGGGDRGRGGGGLSQAELVRAAFAGDDVAAEFAAAKAAEVEGELPQVGCLDGGLGSGRVGPHTAGSTHHVPPTCPAGLLHSARWRLVTPPSWEMPPLRLPAGGGAWRHARLGHVGQPAAGAGLGGRRQAQGRAVSTRRQAALAGSTPPPLNPCQPLAAAGLVACRLLCSLITQLTPQARALSLPAPARAPPPPPQPPPQAQGFCCGGPQGRQASVRGDQREVGQVSGSTVAVPPCTAAKRGQACAGRAPGHISAAPPTPPFQPPAVADAFSRATPACPPALRCAAAGRAASTRRRRCPSPSTRETRTSGRCGSRWGASTTRVGRGGGGGGDGLSQAHVVCGWVVRGSRHVEIQGVPARPQEVRASWLAPPHHCSFAAGSSLHLLRKWHHNIMHR
jgi:hypothetical protein